MMNKEKYKWRIYCEYRLKYVVMINVCIIKHQQVARKKILRASQSYSIFKYYLPECSYFISLSTMYPVCFYFTTLPSMKIWSSVIKAVSTVANLCTIKNEKLVCMSLFNLANFHNIIEANSTFKVLYILS